MVPVAVARTPTYNGGNSKAWQGKTVMITWQWSIINSVCSKDAEAMHLRRCLAILEAKWAIKVWAEHVKEWRVKWHVVKKQAQSNVPHIKHTAPASTAPGKALQLVLRALSTSTAICFLHLCFFPLLHRQSLHSPHDLLKFCHCPQDWVTSSCLNLHMHSCKLCLILC